MRLTKWLGHPARVIPAAYLVAIAVGTLLLLLPIAAQDGRPPGLLEASFTAVSALCITGLTIVDTATYWSPFGQVVIMLLIQVGGYGIVTLATVFTLAATGRLSLQTSILAREELHQRSLADALRLPGRIGIIMLAAEAVTAVVLTFSFRPHSADWGTAAWYGVFHAVSAFNNAGFALFSDNLIGFVGNASIIVPICVAIVVGGIGFPVLFELGRRWRPRSWRNLSAHARLTLGGTLVLLVAGAIVFAIAEWTNPRTLGPMPLGDKLLATLAGSVFPRTAGFNSIDYGAATEATLGLYYLLMFIGGGSAGTAGGIKVGTVGIILATVAAELRAENQVRVAHRAIPRQAQRSALTVATLALATVTLATAFIVADDRFTLAQVLFETLSAFGTVGLTTGITPYLHPESQVVLMLLMYLGRVGTISIATALALRGRHRRFRLPEEQPIVG
ncbi:MAG: TrkH family potassium uptake protein [Actinomycetes bacterium]